MPGAGGICLILLLLLAGLRPGAFADEAEHPLALHPPHYHARVQAFLEDNPKRQPGGVVFFGDSITEGQNIESIFADRNWINRGVAGDLLHGSTQRLEASIGGLRPRTVYVMIGLNEFIWWPDRPVPEDFGSRYRAFLADLRRQAPDAEIILQSILPVAPGITDGVEKVHRANAIIRRIAAEQRLAYVDLHAAMIGPDGAALPNNTAPDGIHLRLGGVLTWLEMLLAPEDYLRAAEHLAPHYLEEAPLAFPNIHEGQLIKGDVIVVREGKEPLGGLPEGAPLLEAVTRGREIIEWRNAPGPVPEGHGALLAVGEGVAFMRNHLRPGMAFGFWKGNVAASGYGSPAPSRNGALDALRREVLESLLLWENRPPMKDRARTALLLLQQERKRVGSAQVDNEVLQAVHHLTTAGNSFGSQ